MCNPLLRKPLVAVSALPRPVSTGYGPDEADTIAKCFTTAVLEAGGLPVLLPVIPGELAEVQLEPFDALILTGGQDLATPEAFEDPKRWIDPDRDEHEFGLWEAAHHRELPILGVCRGAQLAGFAAGGRVVRGVEGHNSAEQHETERHTVEVEEGTSLAKVLGAGEIEVNTLHSQAVTEVAGGLRISARAPDGTVEAVEDPEPDRFIGVQWHPELMLDSPAGQPLFDWVVESARHRTDRART